MPATGCSHVALPDDTPCPDQNRCNGGEVCIGGSCGDRPDLDCDDHNPCTSDRCDPASGCINTPIASPIPGCGCPNGDHDCDDHDVCNGTETCDPSHQFCRPGTPLDCRITNPCLIADCDDVTGCFSTSVPPGTDCNDGNACTIDDECTGGVCGGDVLGCNDGNPCTNDGCDPQGGCTNTPIQGCGGDTLCSLTQGAYGAPGGIANGGQGWITNNPGVLPISIGAPGTGRSVRVNNQSALQAFMPTGGPPNALCGNPMPVPCPGDLVLDGPDDVPDPSGSGSGGDGAGVLAGQTLALSLGVALSNLGANPTGFGSHALASSFCTCDGKGGKSGPFTISKCILDNAGTVNNLLSLANKALSGIPLPMIDVCLTYSNVNAAIDTLNNAFDECRTVCPCGS